MPHFLLYIFKTPYTNVQAAVAQCLARLTVSHLPIVSFTNPGGVFFVGGGGGGENKTDLISKLCTSINFLFAQGLLTYT